VERFGNLGGATVGPRYSKKVQLNRYAYISKIRVNEAANEGQFVKLDPSNEDYATVCSAGDNAFALLLCDVKDVSQRDIDQGFYPNTVRKGGVCPVVYAPAEVQVASGLYTGTFSPGDSVYVGTNGYASATASGNPVGVALVGGDGTKPLVFRLT